MKTYVLNGDSHLRFDDEEKTILTVTNSSFIDNFPYSAENKRKTEVSGHTIDAFPSLELVVSLTRKEARPDIRCHGVPFIS